MELLGKEEKSAKTHFLLVEVEGHPWVSWERRQEDYGV